MGTVHRRTAHSTCASSCGRPTALRLASSLDVSQPRWGATTSWFRTPAGAALTAMNAARPEVELLYLAAVRRVGPNRSKAECREPS